MIKKLKTGWKSWDKYLSTFIDRENNILELGSYKGDATEWFLNNLCTNKKSRVYAVDTWEGSPEYKNTNFKIIEKTFNNKMKKINKLSQLEKLKMTTENGLVKLLNENINFDIIFIDASHIAKDVLSDAILSWKILKKNGVLIFDDYKWNKLEKNIDKPKIAIDSFLKIYENEIELLYSGYQVIIKKVELKSNVKLNNYYELRYQIDKYKLPNISQTLDFNINYKLSLRLSRIVPKHEKYLGFDKNIEMYMNYYLEYKKKKIPMKDYYYLNRFLKYIENPLFLFNTLPSLLKKKLSDHKCLNKFFNIFDFLGNNLEIPVIEIFSLLNKYKLFHEKKEVNILNSSFSTVHNNNKIKKLFKVFYSNVKKIKFYDINVPFKEENGFKKNNNSNNTLIKLRVRSFNDLLSLNKKIDKKLDLIIINFQGYLFRYKNDINFEQSYIISQFYEILFCLKNQNKNGVSHMIFKSILTSQSLELLCILKKYYEEILLIPQDYEIMLQNRISVIASGFKGISKKELLDLYKLGNEIHKKNNNFNNINDNYYYVHSFIDIDNKELNKLKKNIFDFNKKYYKNELLNKNIYKKIVEIFDNTNDKNKINKYKLLLNQKQLDILFDWLIKHDILKYIDNKN